MANRFSIEAIFKAVDRVSAPVTRMQNRVSKFTRGMSRGLTSLTRTTDRFSRGIERAGIATVASLALTGAAMANVIGIGASFEDSIVRAAVKFPGEIRKGTEAFRELEEAARDVGRTTEFTATQTAAGLDFLAMAGLNAKSSISALPGVVDFATAANLDLGLATDIATDSMGAFNLLSKDSIIVQKNLARVSDVLFLTSIRANTTVEDMFDAVKRGAPSATAAGQSIETTAAMIAIMAGSGIKASRAGTGLKNVMKALATSTGPAAAVFKEFEVATLDSDKNIRNAIDVFEDLSVAMKDVPSGPLLEAFSKMFGQISIDSAFNLVNQAGAMRELRDEIESTTGVTKEMAAVMRDTVRGRMKALGSSVESIKLSIFGLNKGPLSDLLDNLIAWTRGSEQVIATNITGFILKISENFDRIKNTAAVIAGVTGAIIALNIVLKITAGIMAIIAALTSPIGLIVVGLVALAAALVFVIKNWDAVLQSFTDLPVFGPVLDLVLIQPIRELIRLAGVFRDNWEPIKAFFKSLWGDMVLFVRGAVDEIGKMIRAITDDITSITSGVGGFLKGGFNLLFGGGSEQGQNDGATGPQIISPQERTARSIEENRSTETSEVTIRTDPGTSAEVTGGSLGKGLRLQSSGDF